MDYDVLVIGAGPAGSSAARTCAINGLKTLLIDKRKEIGYPVRCAEAMGTYLLPYLPFKIPEELLIWPIKGVEFWAEDVIIRRSGVMWGGYAVNRRKFDKWVCHQAVSAGAELMVDTELVGFELHNKHHVESATLKTKNKTIAVKPKVVIGADGYDSTTLKLLGEYQPGKNSVAEIYSHEMKGMDLISPDYEQLFVGDFIPSGYAYVVPISKNRANVGVCCVSPSKPIEKCYKEFLKLPEMEHQVKNAVKVEDKGGKVSLTKLSKKWVYGNTLIVGDAADQNLKPFSEGTLPAIICGDLAGNTVSAHIKYGHPLENYRKNTYKKLGAILQESDKAEEIFNELFDMKEPKEYLLLLLLMADIKTLDKIKELKQADYNTLRERIVQWNRWHKQTIANTKETTHHRIQQIKRMIGAL